MLSGVHKENLAKDASCEGPIGVAVVRLAGRFTSVTTPANWAFKSCKDAWTCALSRVLPVTVLITCHMRLGLEADVAMAFEKYVFFSRLSRRRAAALAIR